MNIIIMLNVILECIIWPKMCCLILPDNFMHVTYNTGLMLGHRLRRWPNIKPVLCLVAMLIM